MYIHLCKCGLQLIIKMDLKIQYFYVPGSDVSDFIICQLLVAFITSGMIRQHFQEGMKIRGCICFLICVNMFYSCFHIHSDCYYLIFYIDVFFGIIFLQALYSITHNNIDNQTYISKLTPNPLQERGSSTNKNLFLFVEQG